MIRADVPSGPVPAAPGLAAGGWPGGAQGIDTVPDARAIAVDESAFQAIYRVLARPLWSYLYRVLGSAADADDVLQETFLRYVQSPLATSDERQIRAYLYRIASNLAIDHLRRRTREGTRIVAGELQADMAAVADEGDAVVLRQDMARTFRALTPRNRVLLWLAYVEGSAHREIAAALGLKASSVPVLLFRARRKLARLLKSKGWED
jgi:RNA polymerase sigma-70 factor (ECF subfamily)